MAFLYIGPSGKPWRKHSYSAGNTFRQSALKYYLSKILGWKEKNNKARFELGKAFETAIQHYHEHNGEGAVDRFRQEWMAHVNNKELSYTKVEKDWANCLQIGIEWLKLYAIRQPQLPIPLGGNTLFQREYSKEVFAGDPNYGEIEFAGKLDIVTYVDPNHPMLPKLNWKPEYGPFRPLIVDIKTAGADYPESYGIAAYDLQLRVYSWVSGIRDVAFCTFVKKGRSLQKGSSVTLLEDAGIFKAGQEAVIAQVNDEDLTLVANDYMIEEMEKAQGKKEDGKTDQTKAAKLRRDEWLKTNGVFVPAELVTKQRLQFNAGYVSIESANDAGEIAACQIIDIVNAWKKHAAGGNGFPNEFGIRYPKDDRSDPYFQAFVLGDEAFKKLNFTKTDEDTVDDLFAEQDNEAE
jgi:hypothetical protein